MNHKHFIDGLDIVIKSQTYSSMNRYGGRGWWNEQFVEGAKKAREHYLRGGSLSDRPIYYPEK